MKEFNLSEKIYTEWDAFAREDVKEFIKLLKEELEKQGITEIYNKKLLDRIDKLAGEDLI